jgi:trans-aconitate methyltransferase
MGDAITENPAGKSTGSHAFAYPGGELALFEKALNWKAYWRDQIEPYVSGDVLEVGAGIGSNARSLASLPHRTWTCLEPDAALAAQIPGGAPGREIRVGTLQSLNSRERFDSILYIDVLEHIEDDHAELALAFAHLKPRGSVIVLAPAHQNLFTPFDAAIGHYRRYSRSSLKAVADAARRSTKIPVKESRLAYLDSAGLLAPLANRLLLSQAMPTEKQILTWDRMLVPASRIVDPLLGYRVGKTVLGIWRAD